MAVALSRVFLWLYRMSLGLFIGGRCRFYPSCSRYAEEALNTYGFYRGWFCTWKRLLRCHPWAVGGWDPVLKDDAASAEEGSDEFVE